MKIAIAGAGAMGSRFGFMLTDAGHTVNFIDPWKEHVEKINQEGLLVETENTSKYYKIPSFLPNEVVDKDYELIILFTKAMQLEGMLKQIQGILTENTALLVLSNGLGNIETIEEYAGNSAIYAGVTLWSCELEGPAHIRATGSGNVEFQPVKEKNAAMTEELLTLLNQAKLNAEISQNVVLSIWKKAAFNSVLNTYCALLDCNVGQFGSSDQAMALSEVVVNEFVAVATAKNVPLTADMVLATVKKVFDPEQSGDHFPSMHQDITKRRKTEIDYLNGAVVKMGASLNIPVPANQLLTALIHEKEDILKIK
ncbi:2-dehydropantoate 2-reductase [Enterococcus sp. PF1-24]|uniref:oxidoreductase n=1 Tax=unclassified Enterococcus TaxID=2608891 RepID=UPI002476F0BB|nr:MULTISPECIES: oxidoreductase [unclassified Enterococcus]MDH6365812.1 2-dehydropantoate 2-reductase [Enterococcus sp. PFB1-1]MDH6402908.1 2-dehydropantoate 2-reductase [Enterococcus sp. PF1-24]